MFVPFKLDYAGYRIVRQKDRYTATLRHSIALPPWAADVPAPDTLYWPDPRDTDGMKRLIDAVGAAALPSLKDFSSLFPNFNFGIGMFVELLVRAAEKMQSAHGINPVEEIGVAKPRYPEPVGAKAKVKYQLSSWDMIDGMRGEVVYYLWGDERATESVRINIWIDVLNKPTILTRIGASMDGRLVVVLEDHPGRYRGLGLPRGPLERLLKAVRAGTMGGCSVPKVSPRRMPPFRQPAPSRSETSLSSSSSSAIGG